MAEEAAPKKRPHTTSIEHAAEKPWVAMWSLVIGFFMILLDTTIVTVATHGFSTVCSIDGALRCVFDTAGSAINPLPCLLGGTAGQ